MSEITPDLDSLGIIPYDQHGNELSFVGVTAYSGPVSPLTFQLRAANDNIWQNQLNPEAIYWHWGDGNSSSGLTASHTYNRPGKYTVTCSIIDYGGGVHALPTTKSAQITIQDYIGNACHLDILGISATNQGILSNIDCELWSSWQSFEAVGIDGYGINLYSENSGSRYISEKQYKKDKLSHFRPTWSFIADSDDRTPIRRFPIGVEKIYGTPLTSGDISLSTTETIGSHLIGVSGNNQVSYVDDTPGLVDLYGTLDISKYPLDISLTTDTKNIYDLEYNPMQQFSSVQSLNVLSSAADSVAIKSNGVLDISPIKWTNTPIAFSLQLAVASADTALKTYPPLSAGLLSSDTPYEFHVGTNPQVGATFYKNTDLPDDYPGAFNGYVIFDSDVSSVQLTAAARLDDVTVVTGASEVFNVHPRTGKYNIYKDGEDFDMAGTLRSFVLQDTIVGQQKFMNEFMDGVFGTDTSDPETLGKTIYEKIHNFTRNVSDIDSANLRAAYSIFKMIGFDIDEYTLDFPAGIRRLVDLLSINRKRLFGFEKIQDFNADRGDINTNIGEPIDIDTYTVTAGTPIVAYDKYSEKFDVVRPYSLSAGDTYPLSGYDPSWGWGLIVGDGGIGDYYNFFEYVEVDNKDIVSGLIDFTNNNTLLPFSATADEWTEDNGIIENLFSHAFVKGFKLSGGPVKSEPFTLGVDLPV